MWNAASTGDRLLAALQAGAIALLISVSAPLAADGIQGRGPTPDAPADLRVTATTSSTVSVSWSASERAVSYTVYVDARAVATTQATEHLLEELECGTRYVIAVDAVGASGRLSEPSTLEARSSECSAVPEPPAPPPGSEDEPSAIDDGASAPAPSKATGTLVFDVEADARVDEDEPDANFGSSKRLRANGGGKPDVESYLRVTVSGVTGAIERATLRLAAFGNTADGPAVYSTTTTWSESSLTWRTRPGPTGEALDDVGPVARSTWVELDVTRAVTGDGTYAFRLATGSDDGVDFHSRERRGNEPHLLLVVSEDAGDPSPGDDPPDREPPPGDTTPPTQPAALAQTGRSETTVSLSWAAATDDIGVTGYGVYVDGKLAGSTASTAYTVGGLSCGGTFSVAVDAYDAAGNRSARSVAVSASTGACSSPGSTFYVAPGGSDSNPGTAERPWLTIGKAMATLAAGETAYLRAGTYEEATGGSCGSSYNVLTWSRSGAASAPITISGYPGEERQVIVRTKLKLTGSHLRLVRFVVDRNTAYSSFDRACTGEPNVNLYGDDLELFALEIRNSNMSGVYVSGADRVSILRNWIHDNGTHARLDHGIYFGSGSGGVIANNLIERSLAFGIQMYPSPSGQVVTQNTIVGSGKAGLILDGASNVVVTNNISAWNAEQGIRTGGSGCPGCWADQNLLFGNASAYYLPTPLSVQRTILSDPRFVDRAGRNYRLAAGSPAADVARADYSRPFDYDGTSRPQGPAPDVGAFER